MATSGRDGALKLWDIRTYRPLHEYHTPRIATSIDISDTGMLAAVHGASVQVFKDCLAARANGPYMTHMLPRCVGESARFCPFEDTLGIGHSTGFCSMLVPGSGEPNFDSYEANPYEGRTQRREGEVISLLEKLPPETILLDPSTINTVERNQTERLRQADHAMGNRTDHSVLAAHPLLTCRGLHLSLAWRVSGSCGQRRKRVWRRRTRGSARRRRRVAARRSADASPRSNRTLSTRSARRGRSSSRRISRG